MEFDNPVAQLHFYQGEVTRQSDRVFAISNKNYNGINQAGDLIDSGWQIQFPEDQETPHVVKAEFLDLPCPGAPLATISNGTSACIKFSNGHSWNRGQDGNVKLTFPIAVDNWEIQLEFDNSVDHLDFYHGQIAYVKSSDTTFYVKNENWNGVQKVGGVVESGWQAHFPDGQPAKLMSAEFVGFTCNSTAVNKTIYASNGCIQFSNGHSWNLGQDGEVVITLPVSVSTWEIKLTFDSPVHTLHFYHGLLNTSKSNDTIFFVENQNWNGDQSAGDTVTSGWQAHFNESSPARLVSAELVGIDCPRR